ncbi:hypothetical protein GCM10009784_10230 [Arthrobacter parietis]|uniref:Uncharacterized protein n=2 Tax=Arthrobacter TaxID=1663 RepID=A0ABT6CS96_9MICC|nr:hypothetical protein [Arthrobacter vasquezii]MDF9276955.1 hypothetical protein [Arthrobacter vasquezii]
MNRDYEEAQVSSNEQPVSLQERQLYSVQRSQYRLTRWFGVWMCVVGFVLIPSGFVLPWPLELRLLVIGVTMVVLWAASLFFRARKVIPNSWHVGLAIVLWVLLSIALDVLVPANSSLAVAVSAAVAATLPFYVIGSYFLIRRPAGNHDTYTA